MIRDEPEVLYGWVRDLFPIHRSITGEGVRQTLAYLAQLLPGLTVQSVRSGTPVLDWTVPDEWNVRDAYLLDPDGRKVVDFKDNNLHIVGYSQPIDAEIDLEALQPRLHSLPDKPDAIPYVTSYYSPTWGFCLADRVRRALKPGKYRAVIDSTIAPGHLNYGELVLPGDEEREVFLSTYVCHPSMANNELSGPAVATAVMRTLMARPRRRYTYRLLLLPETIGAIAYLSRHLNEMQRKVVAGFVVTCVGDERAWTFLGSRQGDTVADRAARHVLRHAVGDYGTASFLDRGSDERQYCNPGVDLPVVSIMRSRYATYPEYHTSLDDLSLVTPRALADSATVLLRTIDAVEANSTYRTLILGEPQLGKRGLYPSLSTLETEAAVRDMINLIGYSDGTHDLIAIADAIGAPIWRCREIVDQLLTVGVLARVNA